MVPAGNVHLLEHLGHHQSQGCSVDALAAWIVGDTDDFGLVRIVDVQGEIVSREHPVEGFGSETVERDSGRCNLALQLLEGLVLDGIHEGIALDLQLRVLLEDLEDIAVILAHQLDQVREGAVSAPFVNL